jgi:hypothetical protein
MEVEFHWGIETDVENLKQGRYDTVIQRRLQDQHWLRDHTLQTGDSSRRPSNQVEMRE